MILRLVAFGNVDSTIWGVAWIPESGAAAGIACGTPSASAVVEGTLTNGAPEADWSLDGEDISLVVSPVHAPSRAAEPEGRLESEQALCSVKGQLVLAGAVHALSCPGWRAAVTSEVEIDQLDSLRAVAGWIGSEDGVALIAVRPRKARGQESDTVLAGVLEPAGSRAVADPRLSTTYAASGVPARAGLELWFEEAPGEDDGAPEARYPRRAAGEAVGSGIEWQVGELSLRAQPMRWHTQGREGSGIYVLGRRH